MNEIETLATGDVENITSPYVWITDSDAKFEALIEAYIISDKSGYIFTSRSGTHHNRKACTVTINVEKRGTYNITFSMYCSFGYNGSSSGPYNSLYGFSIKHNTNTTLWSMGLTPGDNAWFSGYMSNTDSFRKWKTITTVNLTLAPGKHVFDLWVEQQDIRNKHCTTRISEFRATINSVTY